MREEAVVSEAPPRRREGGKRPAAADGVDPVTSTKERSRSKTAVSESSAKKTAVSTRKKARGGAPEDDAPAREEAGEDEGAQGEDSTLSSAPTPDSPPTFLYMPPATPPAPTPPPRRLSHISKRVMSPESRDAPAQQLQVERTGASVSSSSSIPASAVLAALVAVLVACCLNSPLLLPIPR